MTSPIDPAGLPVAFDRHPAAIDRHSGRGLAIPRRPGPNAFSDITTWSPFEQFALPAPVAAVWDTLAPLLPEPAPQPSWPPMVAPLPMPARALDPPLPAPVTWEPEPPGAPLSPFPAAPPSALAAAPVQTPVVMLPALPNDPAWATPEPQAAAALPASDAQAVTAAQRSRHAVKPRGDMLWPGGAWDDEPDGAALPPPPRRPRPNLRRVAPVLAACAVVAALIYTGWLFLPGLTQAGRGVTAVFNAPMMVVRAAAAGRVLTVAANAGQVVEPRSPLLTIRMADPSGPEKSVLAGVNGMVRSVETVPGADLAAGTPLVRLQDCDRAFLTVPAGVPLTAGQQVQVKLANLPVFAGTVRDSVGIMEPPNALVVGLAPGAVAGACPVGAAALVTPAAA